MVNRIIGIVLLVSTSITLASPAQKIQFGEMFFKLVKEDNESIISNAYIEHGLTLDQ